MTTHQAEFVAMLKERLKVPGEWVRGDATSTLPRWLRWLDTGLDKNLVRAARDSYPPDSFLPSLHAFKAVYAGLLQQKQAQEAIRTGHCPNCHDTGIVILANKSLRSGRSKIVDPMRPVPALRLYSRAAPCDCHHGAAVNTAARLNEGRPQFGYVPSFIARLQKYALPKTDAFRELDQACQKLLESGAKAAGKTPMEYLRDIESEGVGDAVVEWATQQEHF